jgi:hypothetical protein
LQRRWTPDPAAEVIALRKEVTAIHEEFSQFKQNVEAQEKERAEFEHFPFQVSLQQGSPGNYVENTRNDSKYKVTIETIQILRGDTNHDSQLTEAVKARKPDDWTIDAGTSRSIFWMPQHDPISMLKSLVRSPDPNYPNGRVITIALLVSLKVNGNRTIIQKYPQQVTVQGTQVISWGPG